MILLLFAGCGTGDKAKGINANDGKNNSADNKKIETIAEKTNDTENPGKTNYDAEDNIVDNLSEDKILAAGIDEPKNIDNIEEPEIVGGELDYDGMMAASVKELKNLYNEDEITYTYMFSKDGINLVRNYVMGGSSRGKSFSIQVPKEEIPQNMSFKLFEDETPYTPLLHYAGFLDGAKSYILSQWPFMDYTFEFNENYEEYARKINTIINKAIEVYDNNLPQDSSGDDSAYLLIIPLGDSLDQFMFAEFEVISDSSVTGVFSIFTMEDMAYTLRAIVTLE